MGVKGLWSLLSPVARPIKLETLEGKRLAIDSSIWLYQFQATMRDKDGRVLVNAHVLGFLRRINKLLFHGIKPVFVFDGGAPGLKRQTIAERKRKRSGAAANHARMAEKLFAAQMRREAVKQAQAARDKQMERSGPRRPPTEIAPGAQFEYVPEQSERVAEGTTYLDDLEGPDAVAPRPALVERSTSSSDQAPREPRTPPPEDRQDEFQRAAAERRKKFKNHDPYRLPELPGGSFKTVDSASGRPDPRMATEDELQAFIEDMRPEDFDLNSPDFRSLPTEVQYEIIGDLRIRSRQQSHRRLASMLRQAPTPLDFSKAQIASLSQRNNLTQQLLTVTDTIGNSGLQIPVRMASERNREYVLVRNPESEGGGWVLGVRDSGTKDKPIVIEESPKGKKYGSRRRSRARAASEEEEEDDDDDGIEVVSRPPARPDPEFRAMKQRDILDALTRRLTGNKNGQNGGKVTYDEYMTEGQQQRQPHAGGTNKRTAGKRPTHQGDGQMPLFVAEEDVEREDMQDGFDDDEMNADAAIAAQMQEEEFEEVPPSAPASAEYDEALRQSRLEAARRRDAEDEALLRALKASKQDARLNFDAAAAEQGSIKDTMSTVSGAGRDSDDESFDEVEVSHSTPHTPEAIEVEDTDMEASPVASKGAIPPPNRQNYDLSVPQEVISIMEKAYVEIDKAETVKQVQDLAQTAQEIVEKAPLISKSPSKPVTTDLAPKSSRSQMMDEVNKVASREPLSSRKAGDHVDMPIAKQSVNSLGSALSIPLQQRNDTRPIPVIESVPVVSTNLPDTEPQDRDGSPVDDLQQREDILPLTLPQPDSKSHSIEETADPKPELTAPQSPVQTSAEPDASLPPKLESPEIVAIDPPAMPDSPQPEVGTDNGLLGETEKARSASPVESPVELEDNLDRALLRVSQTPDDDLPGAADDSDDDAQSWSRSPTPIRARKDSDGEDLFEQFSDIPDELEEDEGGVDMSAEGDDYARFLAQIKGRNLDEVRTEIDNEIRTLNQQNKIAMRDSEDITHQMIAQIQLLLRLFGIPYITAPMEAEAQCAELVRLNLVDGVITDDNDVFLFGGSQCFKNLFNDAKFVECFQTSDLERELSLTRDRLITIAYLLGSDYTLGLTGVGPVVAMEIMANFPGPHGLRNFKAWWLDVQQGKDNADHQTRWQRGFKKKFADTLFLTADWPNPAVREAYWQPTVDSSDEPFQWGFPDIAGLRSFLQAELSWSISKVDDELTPIVQRIARRGQAGSLNKQSLLDPFFDSTLGQGAYAPRVRSKVPSKRLQAVIKQFREAEAREAGQEPPQRFGAMLADLEEDEELVDVGDLSESAVESQAPSSTKRKRTKSEPQQEEAGSTSSSQPRKRVKARKSVGDAGGTRVAATSGEATPSRPFVLGYLGPEGSYSHKAATRLSASLKAEDDIELRPFKTIGDLFKAISKSKKRNTKTSPVDAVAVPFENTIHGIVNETIKGFTEASKKRDWDIVASTRLSIQHCLAVRKSPEGSPPTQLGDIRWVTSHEQVSSGAQMPEAKSDANAIDFFPWLGPGTMQAIPYRKHAPCQANPNQLDGGGCHLCRRRLDARR